MYCKIYLGLLVLVVMLESITCAPLSKSQDVTLVKNDQEVTLSSLTTQTPKHKVEDEEDASEYLKKFGYLSKRSGISKNSNEDRDEVREGIKKLQKWHKLNVTGELDNATLTLMNTPRCHLPDITADLQKRFVRVAPWRSRDLSYKIHNYPSKTDAYMTKDDVEDAIQTAMQDWNSVSSLNLHKVESGISNINIGFYAGDHGDNEPFDGLGTVLAHAFFPEDGKLHFDNDEKWSKTNIGTNLRQVTTHELGHALGLDHTNVLEAIMYPYYSYSKDFKLKNDDIEGIVSLYGPKGNDGKILTTPTLTKLPWWRWRA